jgi:hypothetical protein
VYRAEPTLDRDDDEPIAGADPYVGSITWSHPRLGVARLREGYDA